MPVYVYQCKVCGSEQELLHGITDGPKRRLHCEECGKTTPVVRLISAVGGRVAGKADPPSL
jgi:putative FmdB family regulatory protein